VAPIKGRKIRLESDPKLARDFAAGATITLVLPVLHERYGLIYLPAPKYSLLHFKQWQAAHKLLANADRRLLELPIGEANERNVRDVDFLYTIYVAGTTLVVQAVLAFHHKTLEIEQTLGLTPGTMDDIGDRLRKALTTIGFRSLDRDPTWERFVEIHKYRDAAMHPTQDNLYAPAGQTWVNVPLAWYASGKALEASRIATTLFDEISNHWESKRQEFSHPVTVTVKRGMKSTHQVKKSRSND
jgi:hypothetical protein